MHSLVLIIYILRQRKKVFDPFAANQRGEVGGRWESGTVAKIGRRLTNLFPQCVPFSFFFSFLFNSIFHFFFEHFQERLHALILEPPYYQWPNHIVHPMRTPDLDLLTCALVHTLRAIDDVHGLYCKYRRVMSLGKAV